MSSKDGSVEICSGLSILRGMRWFYNFTDFDLSVQD